ncbi:MAG: amidohydrolase family protein [Deinococcus-Thermus bacterium]|jgi:imidazolonepropionase-like amidohydrolase|nr:amidohydrolase family protein [Deinococcota bacterium]
MADTLYAGTFLDADDDAPRAGWLRVEDGRIVGRSARPPADAASAETLPGVTIPGLIDAHVHLTLDGGVDPTRRLRESTRTQVVLAALEHMRAHLEAGVTTVRDLGAPYGVAIELGAAVETGRLTGPRVVACGRNVTMTGGHGHFMGVEADGPDDVRRAVRTELKAGARAVKFMATGGVMTPGVRAGAEQLTEAELRAGAEEAHKAERRAAAHAQGLTGIKNALRAGIDTIEHGAFDRWDEEALALLTDPAQRRWLVATLAAPDGILRGEGQVPAWAVEKTRPIGARHRANTAEAYHAGVPLAAGTDAGTPLNPHGGLARELALLHGVGVALPDVLAAATREAAVALSLDGAAGTLAAGAAADLVSLDGDPLSDVSAYERPLAVVVAGSRTR